MQKFLRSHFKSAVGVLMMPLLESVDSAGGTQIS